MHKKILIENLEKIVRQRNFVLLISIITVFSNIFLVLKIVISDEKIIMIPGLKQDIFLSNKTVSASYLEETSLLFLSHLLDISRNDIGYKRSLILKHTADQSAVMLIQKYFEEVEEKYKKFDLATYFTVKDMQIDTTNLKVMASGVLTSSYGKKGTSAKDENYLIQFEYKYGNIKLKSFERLSEVEINA